MKNATQRKRIDKLAAKRDKLKTRVILGRKKVELKAEVLALKKDISFLKHYNIKKGLEGFKFDLSEIRDVLSGSSEPQPSLKSRLLTARGYDNMDAQQLLDEPEEDKAPQEEASIFGMPNFDLPSNEFSLDLPF